MKQHLCITKLFLLFVLSATMTRAQQADSVFATQITPLKSAAYKFVIKADIEIPPSLKIDLVFPPQFNLSKVVHAGSNKMSGGLKVEVKADTVKLARTNKGNTIVAGETFDIIIASIYNPADMEREYSFSIVFRETSIVLAEKKFSMVVLKL